LLLLGLLAAKVSKSWLSLRDRTDRILIVSNSPVTGLPGSAVTVLIAVVGTRIEDGMKLLPARTV
jgi:hypothetical protein